MLAGLIDDPAGTSANRRALPPPVHASNRSHAASNRVSGLSTWRLEFRCQRQPAKCAAYTPTSPEFHRRRAGDGQLTYENNEAIRICLWSPEEKFEPGNGGIKIRCLTTWLRPTKAARFRTPRLEPGAARDRPGGSGDRRDRHAACARLRAKRRQGYIAGPSAHEPALIVTHPDVKRMLLSMRALTNAARAICYTTRRRDRPGPQRAAKSNLPQPFEFARDRAPIPPWRIGF